MTLTSCGRLQGIRRALGRALAITWLLVAGAGAAARAVEVRVADPLEPIYDAESARKAPGCTELLLTAPRGGVGSAQVVLIGPGADREPVEIGPLTAGGVTFPAASVQIRYAWIERDFGVIIREERETGEDHPVYGPNYLHAYYDRLRPAPDPEAEVHPVWVTATVPADAGAGVYTGRLRIGDSSVPVRLHVSGWLAPEPADFTTHVGIVSSHELVALHYEVEFWSEAHWALIEQEMKFLGTLGADELWLHTNAELGQGQCEALVQFTERDGEIVPDLRVAERYVKLFAEHVGQPSYVIMNYWMESSRRGRRSNIQVFVDGAKRAVPGPEAEGGEAFWGRLMTGLRGLVADQGWPEDIVHVGLSDDQRPSHEVVEAWNRIVPGIAWVAWSHGKGDPPLQGYEDDEPIVVDDMIIGNCVHPYLPRHRLREREGGGQVEPHLQGGWNQGKPIRGSGRNILLKYMRPNQWRSFPNGLMLGSRQTGHDSHTGSAGFGFLALDFWNLPGTTYPSYRNLFLNPRVTGNLHRQNSGSVIEPGPDGPLPTVRFEMLREGLQETEARVVVERALVEGDLPPALAEEARALLTEMFRHRWKTWTNLGYATAKVRTSISFLWGVAPYPEWMRLTARLYNMAGRVAAASAER